MEGLLAAATIALTWAVFVVPLRLAAMQLDRNRAPTEVIDVGRDHYFVPATGQLWRESNGLAGLQRRAESGRPADTLVLDLNEATPPMRPR